LHVILPSEKAACDLDNVNRIEEKVTINDFLLIKSLASGAFGKVILSRKKNTKEFFAIKVLDIQKMKQKNCQETIMNEKNILNGLNTDFITRGVYTFKS
jgi:serine/threonine protein kinase